MQLRWSVVQGWNGTFECNTSRIDAVWIGSKTNKKSICDIPSGRDSCVRAVFNAHGGQIFSGCPGWIGFLNKHWVSLGLKPVLDERININIVNRFHSMLDWIWKEYFPHRISHTDCGKCKAQNVALRVQRGKQLISRREWNLEIFEKDSKLNKKEKWMWVIFNHKKIMNKINFSLSWKVSLWARFKRHRLIDWVIPHHLTS